MIEGRGCPAWCMCDRHRSKKKIVGVGKKSLFRNGWVWNDDRLIRECNTRKRRLAYSTYSAEKEIDRFGVKFARFPLY
jgi:hypothetical protein